MIDVEGPPHDRRFVCVAVIAGEQVGIGKASTKKAAEQEAARQALEVMGIVGRLRSSRFRRRSRVSR